jgi:lysozyme
MKFPVSKVAAAVIAAVALLVGVEGVSTKSYQDTGGVWTICYGYTHGVTQGQRATPDQCWSMLKTEAYSVANQITPYLPANLNSNQLAALISFCYNVGVYNCKTSTMFTLINKGDMAGAGKQFARWHYVKTLDCTQRANNCYGIVLRRAAEANLWNKPL